MQYVVRMTPLRRSIGDLLAFVAALRGPRRAETGAFFRRYGVRHESWHLQDTPDGLVVLVVTRIDAPAPAADAYAASKDDFELWFKSRVLDLSGNDPNEAPLGPPTLEVFAWDDVPGKE
ncbi:hypothetical protein [Nannocystis punicea]|uniref:Uncharacterized protein n=1 Tax=Nannocystis punicea TaxID=2995304 RepID=A0ABY7HJK9_9BACT|nr:hypothetical protein [Nannocystis poenicansa]WAS99303.1 hypothetical protein O0S08_24510 [Nannocystis poenicansa]